MEHSDSLLFVTKRFYRTGLAWGIALLACGAIQTTSAVPATQLGRFPLLEVAPVDHLYISSAQPAAASTTPLGLFRMPRYPGSFFEFPMDDRLAFRQDDATFFWFRISNPEVGDTWRVDYRSTAENVVVNTGAVRFIFVIQNGQSVPCYELIGATSRLICGNTLFVPGIGIDPHTVPFGFYEADLFHNDQLIHSEEFYISDTNNLHPNPHGGVHLVARDGSLTRDIDAIVGVNSDDSHVNRATTDGKTQFHIRAMTRPGIPVTFSISNGPFDGTLSSLDGSQGPTTSVTPRLETTSDGHTVAVAIYTVPVEFSESLSPDKTRQITFTIEFGLSTGPWVLEGEFTLIRPPLMAIHGMFGSQKDWDKVDKALSKTRKVVKVDWWPAITSLTKNLHKVEETLTDLRKELRSDFVASTLVDVIGHSAGGLLARKWVQFANYRRRENLMQGDFRKLITIGTPHFGTPVADLVANLSAADLTGDEDSVITQFSEYLFDSFAEAGLLDDLKVGTFSGTPIPGYAWIGVLPTMPGDGAEDALWLLLARMCQDPEGRAVEGCDEVDPIMDARLGVESLRSRTFGNIPNDGLVTTVSQAGGLSGSQAVLSDTGHTVEPQATTFVQNLQAILDVSLDNPGFP